MLTNNAQRHNFSIHLETGGNANTKIPSLLWTLVSTVITWQYCASERERDSGHRYESGYKKRVKKKKTILDVKFSTDKIARKNARYCKTPMKGKIVCFGS